MTITDRIEINPKVMLGKPVIRGTRIPVELILRKLSEGAVAGRLSRFHEMVADLEKASDVVKKEARELYMWAELGTKVIVKD